MKRLLIIWMVFMMVSAKAQFTGTDSLRNYNNRFITTNPATAFTNNRLNTLLRGIIDFIDTARAGGGGSVNLGVDTVFAVNDSTIRYRKNGVFRQFTLKGVYDSRRKVDTIYKSNDTTLTFTVNGALRTVIIPGGTNLNLATANQTATGNRNHNWNDYWLYLNNVKSFELNTDHADPNHLNNRYKFQLFSDSTINGYPFRLLWGLKNINDDFTDSSHFELTSSAQLTYLYHYQDGGSKSIEMDWDPYSYYPSTKIYANGNSKNGYYELGASTAEIHPQDSTLIKAVPAANADSVLGIRALSNGVNTVVKFPTPSGGGDTTNKWINDIKRSNDSVFAFKNGSWQFKYKDSVGSGGGGSLDTTTIYQRINEKANDDTVWKRQGPVYGLSVTGDSLQEPTIIREGNPQILTGATTVFKMWYTQGWNTIGVYYGESLDGRNWVYSPTPVVSNHCRSSLIKDGSTYVLYAVPGTTGAQVDRYTSSDGVTFSLANAAVISQGSPGTWNDAGIFNSWVIKDGSTYRMLIDGLSNTTHAYADGYYTSSDGITWTQYGNNPVTYITGPYFRKIGSTYWLWGHAAPPGPVLLPTDAYRAYSNDMINWNYDPIPYTSTFHRLTHDEGVDSSRGQVADLCFVDVGDSVYMYYSATPNGDAPGNGVQKGLQIKLAVAHMPITQLITTDEGAREAKAFERSGRDLFHNWGNVGFGKVFPRFPVDALTVIQANNGFVSWNSTSEGGSGPSDASAVGYNLYHRSTSPIWRLIDTTNHGMAMIYGVNDIKVMATATVNTSSPTVLNLGSFKRTDSTFNWAGRVNLGGATDDGVHTFNSNGPFLLNGNATFLGTINSIRIGRGGGSVGDNVRVGANALSSNTSGDGNSAFGEWSLFSNTSGGFNTGLGVNSGYSNVSGNFNTSIGNLAAYTNTGSNVTAVGRATLYSATGDGNTAVGTGAGRSITSGSNNLALGLNAFWTDGTTASTNVSGSVAVGYNAQVTQNNSGALGGINANGFGMRWGIGITAPSAWLHLPAGLTTAGFAPLRFTNGEPTTTPAAGQFQYKNGLYIIDSSSSVRDTIATRSWARNNINGGGSSGITTINGDAGPAFSITNSTGIIVTNTTGSAAISVNPSDPWLPHVLDKQYSDANNTGTSESDLYSFTTAVNTLALDGQSIHFETSGTLNDATASVALQFYFGGTSFGNTGAQALLATGSWCAKGYIMRATSTTAKAYVVITSDKMTDKSYVFTATLTGLDFTDANVLKCTGQASGGGGGSNDITQTSWVVKFEPITL